MKKVLEDTAEEARQKVHKVSPFFSKSVKLSSLNTTLIFVFRFLKTKYSFPLDYLMFIGVVCD